MAYLVASAEHRDLAAIQKGFPQIWRRVRRYNLPVQLALAAAEEVISAADDASTATIISLAPCHTGSADLFRWVNAVTSGMASNSLGDLRMNPTQTLHAVDNLAMSSLSITYGNRADCLGLGGAPGQAWSAVEAAMERFATGITTETLIMAGDQVSDGSPESGLGVALLLSNRARPYLPLGRVVRFVGIQRKHPNGVFSVKPHAAEGLSVLVAAIRQQRPGLVFYDVPLAQTDGVSSVTVVLEISS